MIIVSFAATTAEEDFMSVLFEEQVSAQFTGSN